MDSPSSEGDPGPRIHRPVPRRPFNLNFANATPPPDEDSAPTTPHISANDLRFLLDPRFQQQRSPNSDTPLPHTDSLMNLASGSTLSGIYQPTTPGGAGDGTTPWGTGAETPAAAAAPLDTTPPPRDRPSPAPLPQQQQQQRVSLVLRAALLFLLGMGHGALLTHLPTNRLPSPPLFIWGLAGVALGSLLPWFDRVWEETFGRATPARPLPLRLSRNNNTGGGGGREADWALVVRGIGAFVGIVFAIRRLPWTSTMQASLTLALANPVLWYLIDRSKPGFLLSAAVGVAGAAGVVGGRGWGNGTAVVEEMGAEGAGEVVETGIWVVSVLFCSCVCFGNIGRRLALGGEGVVRGRWGGVR
ncbi:putative insig domain-protein [Podospora conica]|nr:putative insig domain-protein [Schizothecium conicum]